MINDEREREERRELFCAVLNMWRETQRCIKDHDSPGRGWWITIKNEN
jgi:hypothetical protein